MTAHLKDGKKRDKMVSFLCTKPFYSRIVKIVAEAPEDEELRNLSDLIRLALKKEIKRREGS